MLSLDEDALYCDLAETYGVFDLFRLKPTDAARLAVGLRDNSRIMIKISGSGARMEVLLLALIADKISDLVWLNSKDGQDGTNRPVSILRKILGQEEISTAFESPEEFEAARNAYLRKGDPDGN